MQLETESLQNKRKDGSKSVGLLMKDGKKAEAEQLKTEITEIGDQLGAIEAEFQNVQGALDQLLMETPNLPDASVPDGLMKTTTLSCRWLVRSQALGLVFVIISRLVNCSVV